MAGAWRAAGQGRRGLKIVHQVEPSGACKEAAGQGYGGWEPGHRIPTGASLLPGHPTTL